MKKFFLSLVLSLMAVTAFAQIKSVDAKVDYRLGTFHLKGDPGIGLGITMELAENFDLAPRFIWYMVNHGTQFNAEADLHYNFEINEDWYAYPIIGAGLFHNNWKDDLGSHNHNKVLGNLGVGAAYQLNENFRAFAEAKYQQIVGEKDFSDTYISIGISYCF